MKNKLRIAVAVIAASVIGAISLVSCGAAGGGGIGGTVTGISISAHRTGVAQRGQVQINVRVEGIGLGPSVPLIGQAFLSDEYGVRLYGAAGSPRPDTRILPGAAFHEGTNEYEYYDYFDGFVVLRADPYEVAPGYVTVIISTNSRGSYNMTSEAMTFSLTSMSGQVGSVQLTNQVTNAHRSSDASRVVARPFNVSVIWAADPLPEEVPDAELNDVAWSIVSGVTPGSGTSINPTYGTLIIPRAQMPGTLVIRATTVWGTVYAQGNFTVNEPVVNQITFTGVQGVTRGASLNLTAAVAGLGYPQDLPRDIVWSINQTTRNSLITRGQNPLDATLSVTGWEHNHTLVVNATDVAASGATFSQNTGAISVSGDQNVGAFVDVEVGDYHILARGWDGSLWAWGRNDHGQLGLGDTNPRTVPTRVGMGTDWEQISAGQMHSLAIRTGGQMWAWGFAGRGSVGLGPNNQGTGGDPRGALVLGSANALAADPLRPPPVTYPRRVQFPYADGWASVSAGGSTGIAQHWSTVSVAQRTDGTVYTFGTDTFGQAGTGTTITQWTIFPTPRRATALPSGNWTSVSAGRSSSVAAINSGFLYTWGSSFQGEGGRGRIVGSAQPGAANHPGRVAHPQGGQWVSVSAGYNFMIAVDNDGRMWSWGSSAGGRLGRTTPGGGNHATPGLVAFPQGEDPRFLMQGVSISQGAGHVLAIDDSGRLWAWGTNAQGQLGRGGSPGNTGIPAIVMPGSLWRSASAGATFSLAIAFNVDPEEDGLFWTWGSNAHGQMGQGTTGGANQNTPQRNSFDRT